jgi:SAM-dependent methyltransferase
MMTLDDRAEDPAQVSDLVCPACLGALVDEPNGRRCAACPRSYPDVAGLRDLRLESDRYLDLEPERAKAERLCAVEPTTDVMGLSAAYYAMCDDIADRCERFLRHIADAEARGAALAERLPSTGQILEVGCGTGGLLVAAARTGRTIAGVDIASRWLIAARRRLSDHGLSVPLLAASAERLPYPTDRFDAVVADSVLEHLDDPARALREWARVLRPGGRLIVWSPNRYTLTTDPHIGLWGLGWLPRRWVPAYLRLRGREFWPPRTLSARAARHLAARAGLGAVTVDPPAISDRWARTRPALQRLAIGAYETARRFAPARGLLRALGPLWELQAIKEGAA